MEEIKEMIEKAAKEKRFNVVFCRSVVTGKETLAYLPSVNYIPVGELVEIGNELYRVILRQDCFAEEEIKKLQTIYGSEIEEVTGSYRKERIVWEGIRE